MDDIIDRDERDRKPMSTQHDSAPHLLVEKRDGIAYVTLNRPERLNAITWKMVEGLIDFTEECRRDDAVRVVVITGAGRAFSSRDACHPPSGA